MNCMKCGRETESDQIFCCTCLLEMEQSPVKPGTVILLPPQKASTPKKQPRKKKIPLTPEESVHKLSKKLLFYRIVAGILAIVVAALLYLNGIMFNELDLQRLIGQNYNTITETEPADSAGR